MHLDNEVNSIDDISETSVYIMMGLSLLFPIILYALTRSVFCWFLDLESMPIAPLLLLLVSNLGVLAYLHVIDYRNLKKVCENTDKLLAALLAFQPVYFVVRQRALGRSAQGAVVYAVVSTLELVGVVSAYAMACIRDVVNLL